MLSSPAIMSIRDRKKAVLENDKLRLTVLPGGGHIAEVRLKSNDVNPLWDPPWDSMEPSAYRADEHPQYGAPIEGGLLSGIAGHNLCLDFFGPPSEEEFAAGLYVHGEGSYVDWDVSVSGDTMTASAELPIARIRIVRTLRLTAGSDVVQVTETATNLASVDRPIGWTQHVTLGPPFLEKGQTEFQVSATASKTIESEFAPGHDRLQLDAVFTWPMAPKASGGFSDLRVLPDDEASGTFTTHLMNPAMADAFFTAYSPSTKTAFGYLWKRDDFPWLGIWEENFSRSQAPWNGKTLTRGMEFGVSPFPETRRQMVDRGSLFGEKGYLWLPAKGEKTMEYRIFLRETDEAPQAARPDGNGVRLV